MTSAQQSSAPLKIDGSNGVLPLAAALADEHKTRTRAPIELGKGLGSSERLDAVAEGRIDIALASHGIDAADIARRGLVVHEFAKSAVVFGVNESVGISNLTSRQICDVFSRRVTNWKALGGADMAIVARTRANREVDIEVIRARIGCLAKLVMPDAVKVLANTGEMASALATTPGAIGVTTSTVAEQSGGRVKALSLDGILPDAKNVGSGSYALARRSYFVTKAAPSQLARAFIAFAKGPLGAPVILANGAVPSK